MRQWRSRLFVTFFAGLLCSAPLLCQQRDVYGARTGGLSVLSDSSQREAVDAAEFVRGLERVASSLALPATDKPLTLMILDSEADLAQIDPALVSEVSSRRYFAEDEAYIVIRHGKRHQEEVIASEYARFLMHEAMWSPPPWFERGFAAFFVDAVLKENGAAFLERTCGAGFVQKLHRRAGESGEVDISGTQAAIALVARFGLRGAMEFAARTQSGEGGESDRLGSALSKSCRAFEPSGAQLQIPHGSAEIQIRSRRDLLDRVASLQLRTREGAEKGIAYYVRELQRGRDSAAVHREIGIGFALRGQTSKAIVELKTALLRTPSDFTTNLYLGVECAYDSNCELGTLDIDYRALSQHPLNPFVHYIHAQRALVENKKVAAMVAMRQAVALRSADPKLHRAFAGVALIAGDLETAEREISMLSDWPDPAVREEATELQRSFASYSEREAMFAQASGAGSSAKPASE